MPSKKNITGIVYSTDPDFKVDTGEEQQLQTLPATKQNLKIKADSRQRAGKTVTLVQGFEGKTEDVEVLAKKLKTFCGTGGAVKDNEIIIQGDNRDKILSWLLKEGYSRSKKI